MRALRLWTYDEAARAVPYLRSVIGSLREHWLDAQSKRRAHELQTSRPGRADRERLLKEEDLRHAQQGAETHFNDALDELMHIDVYLLDPARGVALIPFRKEDDLAWYVYDQFDVHGLSGWRYHNDPLEECRPLAQEARSAAKG
jgi:hypothetical protein